MVVLSQKLAHESLACLYNGIRIRLKLYFDSFSGNKIRPLESQNRRAFLCGFVAFADDWRYDDEVQEDIKDLVMATRCSSNRISISAALL